MLLEYFQMIDKVMSVDSEAQTLTAIAHVPKESPVFEGHFPGHPLVPGVLLIETMAQASGYLILSLQDFERMPFLAGVEGGKLRTFVEPEAKLTVTAELEHDGSGFAVTRGKIASDGKPICNAQLKFKTMPFPQPEFRDMIIQRATDIGLQAETR